MAAVRMNTLLDARSFADLLNTHIDGVEAVVCQGWPEDPATFEDTDAIIVYSDGGARTPEHSTF